ncbi:MAG: trigger factor [Candidatus Daviesbacteria bacterium]|nr:trigger factor [Candidatus Daviesbacteria bacterium]
MVTKNIVNQPKSVVEISVTVPWADLEPKWNEALQHLTAELELPGFRKGQVPPAMAEQNLGTKLNDEFFKIVMPQALVEALQGSNVVPIDYPKYQLVSFAKGQPLVFKALVTQKPQITVGNYKGIKVSKPAPKVITDEDVNKMIEEMFKRWKTRQPSVGTPVTPVSETPDDNFAKAVGALSLADLKTKLKADLENEAKYNNELDYEELILQQVEAITTVDVPEILVTDELNRMLVQLQKRVADMGLLLEDYLKGQNKTIESLKEEWKVQAEKNVKMELGLSEVARLEGVEVTDPELQAEVDKIQDARMKAQFEQEEPRLHLKHSLRQIKTLDKLKTLVSNLAA